MTKIKFSGPFSMRLSSFVAINKIGIATYVRHALGRRMEPTWDANLETGIRFWRHQLTLAMRQVDIARGRQILDSLQTETDDVYDVSVEPCEQPGGHWYVPEGRHGRAALSPIAQDYKGLAPIYLQAGAREILCDMIRDFATAQAECGTDVLLDMWPDMPHDFQAFDTGKQSSTEALSRIRSAVGYHVDREGSFAQGPNTVVARGARARR